MQIRHSGEIANVAEQSLTDVFQHGGYGGGVIHLEAEHDMHIDGKVLADGSDATYTGMGGGSGGSIYLKARFLSGLYDKGSRNTSYH